MLVLEDPLWYPKYPSVHTSLVHTPDVMSSLTLFYYCLSTAKLY